MPWRDFLQSWPSSFMASKEDLIVTGNLPPTIGQTIRDSRIRDGASRRPVGDDTAGWDLSGAATAGSGPRRH